MLPYPKGNCDKKKSYHLFNGFIFTTETAKIKLTRIQEIDDLIFGKTDLITALLCNASPFVIDALYERENWNVNGILLDTKRKLTDLEKFKVLRYFADKGMVAHPENVDINNRVLTEAFRLCKCQFKVYMIGCISLTPYLMVCSEAHPRFISNDTFANI